jgi:hypothetical protein
MLWLLLLLLMLLIPSLAAGLIWREARARAADEAPAERATAEPAA